MSRKVVDDAMELVAAAGGPEALAERAAEPVVSGSRNSEEAVRLARYKPTVRAALEIASQKGRRLAQKLNVEHTIHRKDGVIGEKNSYGNDPNPPKDGR